MSQLVHQIAVLFKGVTGASDWNVLSREKFLAIPNKERVELLCKGCIKFYDTTGNTIPAKDAIRSIVLK